MSSERIAKRLAKAALAKTASVVRGATDVYDPRVGNLSGALGVTYVNGSSVIAGNETKDRLDNLELYDHTHTNYAILAATTASYTTGDKTKLSGIDVNANNYTHPSSHTIGEVVGLQTIVDSLDKMVNQIDAIATVLGITFNGDGTLLVDGYATHTHDYMDNDGTTDTSRTSDGVV